MREAEREALAARTLALADAPEAEVLVFDDDTRLSRFTQNAIHQNVAATQTVVRVRAIENGRAGTSTTNLLTDEALARVAAEALASARLAPPGDAFTGLRAEPAVAPAAAVPSFAEHTADVSAATRAAAARRIFDAAEAGGLWAAGYVETKRRGVTLANSLGVVRSFDDTACGINVKQNAPDSSGFAESFGIDLAKLDAAAVGARAAGIADRSRAPRAVPAGDWTVILEAPAFGELLAYIAGHFSGQALDDGSSFLADGFDRSYAGANVTIVDDVRHPLAPAMPFDFEGTPTQRVVLLDEGIGRGVVTDARYAAKLERPNTGHSLPQPNADGPQAQSLVVLPGTKSVESLIAETERGLLVTRFWYIRPVDYKKTIVTGMTRDGTFLIEHGRIVCGVRNLRFNQSILGALANCEFSSDQIRTEGIFYRSVVPAVKFAKFHFSSTTDF